MKSFLKSIIIEVGLFVLVGSILFLNISTDVFASVESKNHTVVYNGHKYMLFISDYSWDTAKTKCEKLGGHLVTITSEEEQEAVESILTGTRESYWIGGRETDGVLTWITGEEVTYTHWEPGQPDESEATYTQIFSASNMGGFTSGCWDDTYVSGDIHGGITVQGYICEWESLDDVDLSSVNMLPIDPISDTWSFHNPGIGGVRYEHYKRMMNPAAARLMYDINGSCDGGLCYGMSQTVLASGEGFPRATSYEKAYNGYNVQYAKNLKDVSEQDYTHEINSSAIDLIRCFHVYQYTFNSCKNKIGTRNNLQGLYNATLDYQNNNGKPVMVVFTSWFPKSEHALAALGVVEDTEDKILIQVYDSNNPGLDVYICMDSSFSWFRYEWHTKDQGIKESGSSDNMDISYIRVTDDIINQYKSTDRKGSLEGSGTENEGMLISIPNNADGLITYKDNSFYADQIYDDASDAIYPVMFAADEGDANEKPIMFWTEDNVSPITLGDIAPDTEISVANNDTIMTAKSSVWSNIEVDSNNQVKITSDESGSFSVDYITPIEENIETVRIEGNAPGTVTVKPVNDSLILTGAESCTVTTTETVIGDDDQEATTVIDSKKMENLDANEPHEIIPEKAEASGDLGEVKLSKTRYVYDGKRKKPTVIVKDKNGKDVPDSQYEIQIGNKGKAIGVYEITVIFKDGYKQYGTRVLSYRIVPAKSTVKAKAGKKKIKLTAKKVKGKYVKYQFAIRKAGTKKWKMYTSKKNTLTIKKLKSKKKYEVKVRAVAESRGEMNQYWEKNVYGKWSKTKKVKIK